jgi:hypothetical protein
VLTCIPRGGRRAALIIHISVNRTAFVLFCDARWQTPLFNPSIRYVPPSIYSLNILFQCHQPLYLQRVSSVPYLPPCMLTGPGMIYVTC